MSAAERLTKIILLPELKIEKIKVDGRFRAIYHCSKLPKQEYCPNCASGEYWVHEYREVTIRDEPLRGRQVTLKIRKRRLKCKSCKKTFNEPVPGIMKGRRFTEKFRKSLLWACQNFRSLKDVKKAYRCSNDMIYKALYESLQLNLKRKLNYQWPSTIGIDEHAFGRSVKARRTKFVTMVVDFKNKRPMELVEGRTGAELKYALKHIPGRENVSFVALDLSDPYKKFVTEFFPNAEMVADKFHVLRLLNPHILKRRKEIAGNRANWKVRRLLLRSGKKLEYWGRKALREYLEKYPELAELYAFKESLHGFYRIKGYKRANKALTKMTDRMAKSKLKEIKTLRKTLMKWRNEILNYFKTGITNARTEGFNNVAKVLKRNGYGYSSFENYRLRVLNSAIT